MHIQTTNSHNLTPTAVLDHGEDEGDLLPEGDVAEELSVGHMVPRRRPPPLSALHDHEQCGRGADKVDDEHQDARGQERAVLRLILRGAPLCKGEEEGGRGGRGAF